MTDEMTGGMLARGSSAVLGFKCWDKQPNVSFVVVQTAEPFSNDDTTVIQMRTDRNPIISFEASAFNLNGKQAYKTSNDQDDALTTLISEISRVTERVVISVDERTHVMPVRGASIAARQFKATCNFPD